MRRIINTLIFTLLLGSIFITQKSIAQSYTFSQEPIQFSKDIDKLMRQTNNASCIQIGHDLDSIWTIGTITESQMAEIITITNAMNNKSFKARSHFQYFFDLVLQIKMTTNTSEKEFDALLQVTSKIIEDYKSVEFLSYIKNLKSLYKHQAIFYSKDYQFKTSDSTFNYQFIAQPIEVIEEEPIEEVEVEDEGWLTDDWENSEDDSWGDNDGWGNIDDDSWGDGWGTVIEEEITEDSNSEEEMIAILTEGNIAEAEGAIISFEDANFHLISKFDSVTLSNVTGKLELKTGRMVIDTARMDWGNTGLKQDSVFCMMSSFEFNINSPSLRAENVKLTNSTIKGCNDGILRLSRVENIFFKNDRFIILR